MSSPPTISVLMPVYNAGRHLHAAVRSVLAQTFADFEFLIVNDGSTDSSLEMLLAFERKDSRIRIISRPNTGYVVALNEMLAIANGEFIARMDADDICGPNRFQLQVARLRSMPDLVAIGTQVMLMDPEARDLCSIPMPTNNEEIDQTNMSGITAIWHPTAMIRRSALLSVNGYRAEYWPAEDLDLWLRLAEIGKIENLSDVLVKYRQHLSSIGHRHRVAQIEACRRAVVDACRRRGITSTTTHEAPKTREPGIVRITWGWWALGAGNVATARRHAVRAVSEHPMSVAAWRLLYCALRGVRGQPWGSRKA